MPFALCPLPLAPLLLLHMADSRAAPLLAESAGGLIREQQTARQPGFASQSSWQFEVDFFSWVWSEVEGGGKVGPNQKFEALRATAVRRFGSPGEPGVHISTTY